MQKKIKGFENYIIDHRGMVFNTKTRLVKKPTSNRSGKGYLFVDLYNNGVSKRFYIHRLVAEAFIPNTENKPYINHKDGNPQNNCVDNLEWCTPLENVEHASKVLGVMKNYSNHAECCKRKILAYKYDTDEFLGKFNSITECSKKYGISVPNIIENAQCKFRKQLKGMYFVYEEDVLLFKEKISRLRKDITREMVLELKEQGYSHKQMAKILSCSTKTIFNRLSYVEELGV